MNQEQSVLSFYALCNHLKHLIRTGWKDWHVKGDRIESVAEHIYSTQMLAIAMKSQYQYDIDIMKVIYMLAIHELGEIVIGDLTQFQISKEEKQAREHEAVHELLADLLDAKQIEELFLEFDAHQSKEAIFAYQCDKLECDLQCKLYDEAGLVDLNHQEGNDTINDEIVAKLLAQDMSFSKMWLSFSKQKYPYDENFKAISDYAMNHKISK